MTTARVRVGVNLLWLVPGVVGGSEDYALSLVREVARSDEVDLVVFCQPALLRAYPDLGDDATVIAGPGRGQVRWVRLFWENSWLPYRAHGLHLDVLHHLGGTLPFVGTGGAAPSVLTVYDLQPLVHPERFGRFKRLWLRAVLPRSAHRARVVLTLSEHVRQQVVSHLGTPAEQVLVAPPGVRSEGRPLTGPGEAHTAAVEAAAATRARYGLTGPLLLYPAISFPHKNHDVLVRALPAVLAHHPEATLVLTGRPGPNDEHIDELARSLGVGHAVRRLGRIPRRDLDALFDTVAGLVFPSIHEGFGLPLLEAMARGRPILAADASAIPEIVGTNGLLLGPDDHEAWADAIVELLGNPADAAALADAAGRGAKRFRWDETTPTLVALYQRLAAA
jgi:glycosyltransferase involved in cell wall biosynthesis